MHALLRPTPGWPDDAPPSVGADLMAWTNDVIAAIAPFTPAESYQNFPNRALTDWKAEYYAENFPRLVEVKRRYDPHGLFRNEQSIPTRVYAGRPFSARRSSNPEVRWGCGPVHLPAVPTPTRPRARTFRSRRRTIRSVLGVDPSSGPPGTLDVALNRRSTRRGATDHLFSLRPVRSAG
jgi:hypothetical protein